MLEKAAAKGKEPKGESASFRQVYAYVRPHWALMLIGGVLTLATSGTSLALPLVVRKLITDLAEHRSLATVIVLMCALILFTAGVGSYGNYVLRRGAEAITLATRKQLVDRLLRLTVGALDRNEPGDLMSRATTDSTLLRDAISSCFVGFAVGILSVLATVVIMGIIDWLLLLVTWGALSVAGLVVFLVVSRIERATKQAQDSVGVIGSVLERALGAFRTLKANGAESQESERVYDAAVDAYRANVRAAKWEAMIFNIVQLAMQVAFLAALATGGAQVTSGAISVGTLVAFLLYVFFLMSPIGQLVMAITQYQVGAAAVARIEEVERLPVEDLDLVPVGTETPLDGTTPDGATPDGPTLDATAAAATAGVGGTAAAGAAANGNAAASVAAAGANGIRPASVEFDQVWFKYRPELSEVHHGVSFVVPPGGMTAFVGPSGAGKTTVFSLIERFYEPDSGRVLVDGVDTRQWPLSRLRSAIGYVEQDAPVLSGSLRDNLLFGAPEATEDDVAEALRTTRLTDLTERLPDGLDTQVGHRGTRLSGGERQRVAIARALLRRPRLLLLDEATSQLDAINEAALRETVADVAQRITVLVVAHRLSTVTMADRIIVTDAGRVQAMGTHAELVAANPLYAELAATQFLAVGA